MTFLTTYFACHRFAVVKQVQPLLAAVFVLDFCHFALILVVQNDVNIGVLAEAEAKQTLKHDGCQFKL